MTSAKRMETITLTTQGGTSAVRYWSVYEQRWETGRRLPDCELAAMTQEDRARVLAHLAVPCPTCGRQTADHESSAEAIRHGAL
jgi:hypothetical protein